MNFATSSKNILNGADWTNRADWEGAHIADNEVWWKPDLKSEINSPPTFAFNGNMQY